MRGYGLKQVWVKTGSTVYDFVLKLYKLTSRRRLISDILRVFHGAVGSWVELMWTIEDRECVGQAQSTFIISRC